MFVAALATPSPALAALQDNTVQGVAPRGTTINLFDYWLTGQTESDNVTTPLNNNDGINLDHALKFGKGMGTEAKDVTDATSMNKWTGTARPRYGIVENKLGSDGYPVLNQNKVGTNESLAYLFDLSAQEGKAAYSDVKNLLQVDQQGYYYYNSQKNFAQFNEETKDFTLYNTWGVRNAGASPQGQFFPFNTGEQVYDETADGGITQKGSLTSINEAIRHYFGVSMSTRFVQRYDGYTTENQELPVTYNFSGDDDVWIFIDDVLVADLGGIHDMTSVQINFVSGEVITYQDKDLSDSYTEGDVLYIATTLAKIFQDAGVSAAMKDETFANDTYHTLDFFYLERGNSDSNMSLKYNLVTIPETEIQKVDQVGKPLSNVTFEVYDATNDVENGTLLCTSTTDRTGNVVLLDENEFPITLEQLWNKGVRKIKLVETNTPEGHRSVSPIMLNLDRRLGPAQKLYSTIVTSEDPWTTGAYALSKVTTTTADTIMVNGQALTEDQIQNGMLFVVIEKYLKDEDEWRPVYGDPIRGWTVLEDDSEASILAAAQQTNSVFTIASSGAYETEIDDLPGDTLDYTFFDGDDENDNGQLYRGVYYYTAAPLNDWAAAAEKGIHQIENSNDFPRQFSARLYVSNILNRFIVQKLSEDGTTLDGAVFALYDEDSAEEKNDEWVLKTDAEPLATAEPTRTLTSDNDSVDLEGATIFTNLEPGVYWLHEETAPEGYLKNDRLTKVIVTDTGVYADAGVAEDGIEVSRGVGRLVKSMVQFAVADDIDASLYDIVATPYLGTVDENGVISWSDDPAADALHLHYKDGATAVFDYLAEENSEQYFRTDTGIANLTIAQCPTHGTEHGYRQNLTGKDLTNLYTGVTVVHVTDASEPTLTVSKDVKNAPADEPEKSFQFQIALKDADGNLLEGTFDAQVYAKATDGGEDTPLGTPFKISNTPQAGESQNTFELKDNEYLLVSGLPTGARYEVTEQHDEDYVSSVAPTTTVDTNSEDGLTADGSLKPGNSTVAFTNLYFNSDEAKDVSTVDDPTTSIDGQLVGVGDTLHYTVDWVNTALDEKGAPAKATVTVTDVVPDGTELVEDSISEGGSYNPDNRTITWTFEDQDPGATGTVSFDVTVDSSAASTTVENEATINVGEHNPEITTNTVTNPVPGKDVETDGQVGEGSILHYAITFTNTDGEGASATVVDTMTKGQEYVDDTALVTVGDAEPVAANPSSEGDAANGQTLTWQLSDLPANAQVTITFDARVTRDAGATVDNSATVNDHKTNVTTLPYAPDDQKDVFEVDAPTTSVNGQMVGVGDELIYTIDWAAEEDGDLTITDPIPEGTSYVEGSADKGGVYSTEQNQITWTFEGVKSGDKGTVSFKVTVDEDAVTVDTVHNVATITVGENSKQVETTNTVPEKTFEDGTPNTGLQVGDVLTYTIEWANTTGAPATVVVTDHLPAGLTYVEDSAGELATYDAGTHTLTWDLGTQPDGAEGTVSFEAKVNEDATKVEDPLTNTGYVKVGDNHTYQTNTTEGDPKTGDLTVTKTVTSADPSLTPNPDQAFTFTITVKDAAGTPLSGAYTAKTSAGDEQVTFANGVVTTSLKDGESYTITDLPEGAHYTVAENNYADEGFTTSSDNEQGTITEDGATASFTNAYAAKTVDAKLGVTKTVTGAPAPEDFTFSLAFDEDNEGLTEGVTGLDGNTATVSKDELTLAEGASQASASANFGALTFSKPGTYTFKIVETNNAAPVGWTYDQIARTVTVRIDDNGQGKLSVGEIQYYDANGKPATGAVFTNSYVPSGVTVGDDEDSLMVTKQVEGAPTEESFNFTLKLTSDNAASVEGLGQDGTLSVSTDKSFSPSATQADTQTLDFGELTFTAVGTYTFEVTETNQAPEGTSWTYDNATPRTITVTVTDVDFDGQLDATVEGNNPVFINRFAAAGELPLSVTKVLDGRDWMADDPATADVDEKDVFTFNLTAADDVTSAAIEQGFVTLPAGATDLTISTDTPEHTATFGSIAFTKPGEYQFNVTEEQGSIGGITYDTESKLVKVDVADNGNGTLTATVTEGATNNTVTITNTYGTVPGTEEPVETAEFGLTKVFTGKAWEDETFTFTIAPAEGMPADTPMPENTTATVSSDTEDGRIDFGSITYKAEGTYVYTITEEKAGTTEGGITYDDNVATVTVQVSDDLQGGFAHTVQVTGGQQTFTNTYKTELSYDAEGGLRLVKELTGHDIDEGAFSYVVKPVASQTVSAEDAAARFGIEGEKNVAFEPATMDGATGVATSAAQLITGATFTQEDSGKTFVYEVSELQPETVPAGYTYDASVYTVSVAVADDGAGTLTVTTTVTNEAGEVVSEAVYTNGEDEVTPATVTFKNSYDAAGALGKASITATKQLNGGELAGGDFTFELRAADGTVLQTVENAQDGSIVFDEIGYSTQSLLADVAAGRATYNAADDTYHYTYEISEVTDGLAEEGVTPVVTTGTVTVTVTDNGDGTLSATVDASNKPVVLVNDYGTVDEGSALVGISGKKVLSAEDGLNPPEIDGAFEFTITGTTVSGTQNPAPLPEKTTVTNDASGAVSFGTIEYTIENVFGDAQGEDGISTLSVASRTAVFEYTVTEGEKTLDGVTNDPESTRTFTVVVTDNGDGTMTATDEAGNSFDGTALFEFVNTCAVEKEPSSPTGEGGISITKNLEVLAGDREMSAGEFTFVMTETTDPEAEEPARYYATNEADGTVNFEEITFTEPGVYTYVISEVIPVNANGVTYDTASYTATATVTDLRNGHLGVAWSFANADGAPVEEIVFNNVYDIEQPAEVTFGATKVLAGRDLTDGEFTFELKDAEGNVIQTATNTADGKVVFAPVQIDEIGEFTYTVSEVLPQDDDPETAGIQKDDVTYDETVYTATVTVTDTHLGSYDLELSYDHEGTLPSFHNTYVEPPAPEQPGTPGEPGTPGTPGQPIPSTGDPSVVIPAIAAALAGTGLVGITLAGRRRRG